MLVSIFTLFIWFPNKEKLLSFHYLSLLFSLHTNKRKKIHFFSFCFVSTHFLSYPDSLLYMALETQIESKACISRKFLFTRHSNKMQGMKFLMNWMTLKPKREDWVSIAFVYNSTPLLIGGMVRNGEWEGECYCKQEY